MKFFSKKQITKQILSILLVFMISFTTFQPIVNADIGGKLFEPIVHFLAFDADLGINLLQEFLWNGSDVKDTNYEEVYIGPATIFAGNIPRIRC